jgi:iron complex transport system ATP-binding protein
MAGNTDLALIIDDLSFYIEENCILKGIDLKIKKGEFVGLIGPNGAGKTTLLKCINGIYNGQGNIKINDKDLKKLSCKKVAREVSLMHQNTNISFPFSCLNIVLSGRYPYLKRLQTENQKDYRIARGYMDYTDTLKFEARPVTELSGGERQRVFFAKVLTQETELILLDEPTASLDIAHEQEIFRYSSELSQSGKTVIAAVHDLKIASKYCTRLVLMKGGSILADGSVEEVLTSENISRAYGVDALVYRNKISGQLDFYIRQRKAEAAERHIHIIGGGGSSSGIIRQLFEHGYKVSTGVLVQGDSDLQCAEVFGIDSISCEPFSDISDSSFKQNIEYIKKANLTILCDMPFGRQNLRNLDAAKFARKLVILEDSPPENRDFTGGEAIKIYGELKEKAVVTTTARLHEVI